MLQHVAKHPMGHLEIWGCNPSPKWLGHGFPEHYFELGIVEEFETPTVWHTCNVQVVRIKSVKPWDLINVTWGTTADREFAGLGRGHHPQVSSSVPLDIHEAALHKSA